MARSRWLETAFGWLLSAGLHVVLLLGAALVFVEYLIPSDFLYTGFGCGYEDFEPRIEPLPESGARFEERRPMTEDPLAFDEILGGAEEASGQAGSWMPLRDPGISPSLEDPSSLGTSSPTVCNLELARNRKAKLSRSNGPPFTFGTVECKYPARLRACCLGTAQIQSLIWLARHQNPDGGWSSAGFAFCCDRGSCSGAGDPAFDTGVGALSLLAFLGAGYTPFSKDQLIDKADPRRALDAGEVVKKGLRWLIARQDSEGCIGNRGPKFLYNHAIATLALCEAYGMTSMEPLREPAQRAVEFLVAAQNPGAGWRYGVREGGSDTSVTGWAVMALKSAELSQLSFPMSAYAGALAWLDQVTSMKFGVGYNEANSGKVTIPGKNERFDDHPTMSAVGLMSRIFIQKKRGSILPTLAPAIAADLPSTKSGQVDFYYWYYGSLALFQYDGPTGAIWTRWNEPLKKSLLELQKTPKDGCEDGSWDPAVDRWGSEGGRVYATALNTLTFEIYYRYSNVFGGTVPR